MWKPYDWATIRSGYARTQTAEFNNLPEKRKRIINSPIIHAVAINVLANAIGTGQQETTVRSFFFEVRGMYGLDALSQL